MPTSKQGDLMECIERLERTNKWWRFMNVSSLIIALAVAVTSLLVSVGFAFSQREQQKRPDPQPPAAQPQFKVDDDASVPTAFANFFRISTTPEELLIDFGVSDQPEPAPDSPVRISNRVAMNFNTSKRLAGMLQNVTQQVEAAYGPIELDVQKRLIPSAKRPAPSAKFKVDDGDNSIIYTNYCRPQMTPEELILDFGLTTQLKPDPNATVRVSQRVVMSFSTAKRIWVSLHNQIAQIEAAYGPIELDFQKRMLPGAKKNVNEK